MEPEVQEDGTFYLPPFVINDFDPVMPQSQTLDWGMVKLNIPTLHSAGITGKNVKVAVIDTYCNPSHPDMIGAVTREINTTSEQYTVQQNGHGQGTAGIIGARNNGTGVLGVAPDCQIIAIKAMRETGSGDMNEIIAGIDAAVAEGVHIINMSLGTSTDVPAMRAAVLRATNAGILVVCSAGNAGQANSVMFPAKYENAMAIAASNTNGKISAFSSMGWDVDLAAPGEKVLAPWKDNTWAVVSGTSFSAPYVSGCLALLLEAKQLITLGRLEDTAIDIEDPGRDQKAGYGLISPTGFLAKYNVQPPTPPPTPPPVVDPYAKVKQAKQLLTEFLSALMP